MARKTVMTKITSDDKTARINKSNLRLLDDFLAYLTSTQKSDGTIRGYKSDLLIVFTYVLDDLDNKDFQKISKRDLIGLQNWLVSRGNSSARIRRVKAAISSLSNYCESILADDDPEFSGYRSIVRKIENPPLQPVREKTVWSDEELQSLLDYVTNTKKNYRAACVLALAMYSGRRKSELCRFRVSDFEKDKLVCDGALYKSDLIRTKGRGVNGKMIHCYTLAKKFQPYLDAWMKFREEHGIQSKWLFPSYENYDEQISIATLDRWAGQFSAMTGKDFYFHSLRHYYTSSLVRAGIPDSVIQTLVAWESADMVRLYDDTPADEQIGMWFKDGEINTSSKKGISEL